jgi:MoxR-like ATPase
MNYLSENISAQMYNEGFVQYKDFVDAACLSILTGIPAIFHGRGGYGKTEMILAISKVIQCSFGMLECDPETTASHIKGGAVARTIRNEKEDITSAYYNVLASVLQNEMFFFEEALDASFNALSILKAIITNRKLTLNGECVESVNRILFAATNLDPIALKEGMPETQQNSYDAFLQRFLLIEHGWSGHNSQDYAEMFKVRQQKPVIKIEIGEIDIMREDVQKVLMSARLHERLCLVAEKSAENGFVVSPRTMRWTEKLMKAAAYLRESTSVDIQDFRVLKLLSSWDTSVEESIEEEMKRIDDCRKANEKLEIFGQKLENGSRMVREAETIDVVLAVKKAAEKLEQEIANSGSYPDQLQSRLKSIRTAAASLVEFASAKSLESTMEVSL